MCIKESLLRWCCGNFSCAVATTTRLGRKTEKKIKMKDSLYGWEWILIVWKFAFGFTYSPSTKLNSTLTYWMHADFTQWSALFWSVRDLFLIRQLSNRKRYSFFFSSSGFWMKTPSEHTKITINFFFRALRSSYIFFFIPMFAHRL